MQLCAMHFLLSGNITLSQIAYKTYMGKSANLLGITGH